jgi:hypothetical protein
MTIRMPNWIRIFWIIILPGLLIFFGRMIYECIFLTYKNGPQMIGFSFIHLHPIVYIFMILSYFAAIIWILVCTIWMIKTKVKKNRPGGIFIFIITLFIVMTIILLEPISKTLY